MKRHLPLLLSALAVCAALWLALRGGTDPAAPASAPAEAPAPTASPVPPPPPAPPAPAARPTSLPATVPPDCADASGRVRRTVFPAPGATLADLRAAISGAGGEALGWNPDGGYDAMLPRDALPTLRAAGCRLTLAPLPVTPALRRAVEAGGTVPVSLACADEATATRLQARLGGVRVGAALQAEVSAEVLAAALAEEGGILGADRTPEARLCNNVARTGRFLGVDTLQGGDASGLTGAGEVVAVCDSGLSSGIPGYLGQDGAEPFHPGLRARVMAISPQPWEAMYTPDRVRRLSDGNDPDGHGTHVTGSVLGDGSCSEDRRFRGVAPGARVFFQTNARLFGLSPGGISVPTLLDPLFGEAYAAGARIHSNSWLSADLGESRGAVYSLSAWSIDRFVWSHRDFLPLFAAANDGMDTDADGVGDLGTLVSSPALAKNCLTVGAAETYRPTVSDGRDADGVPAPVLNSEIRKVGGADLLADPLGSAPGDAPDRRGVAIFSCRGPLPDGRLKPDLVAPGTQIVSARRAGKVFAHSLLAAPATEEEQAYYHAADGTSMATPLTAGSAAVARQWCREALGVDDPGQTLLRALLLLGAQSIYPGQFGEGPNREIPTPAPNGAEGFGLLSLSRALAPAHAETFDYGETGFLRDFPVEVTAEGTLRAVLVWVDYPAQLYAARTLVNDLDLELLDASGAVVAYPNGLPGPDRVNVAERIEAAVAPGAYTLRVRGHAIPFPDGQAALVCSLPGVAPAPFIAHDPVERLAPGEAVALRATLLHPAAETDALTLETSADGAAWTPAEALTLTAPQAGRFLYRLRAGETVAGPYAVTVGEAVPLTVATSGPFFPATPAVGQTLPFAAGEIVTATALPARTWAVDDGTDVISAEDAPVGGWTLTDAEGRVLDLGVGGTAVFAMPAAPATLTWTAEAIDPAVWRILTFDAHTVLCRVGDRFVLPAPDPLPKERRVVTGVWVAQDGTRHRAGEAYGPVTGNVAFTAERLPWAQAHFDGADYDPEADSDGDGYANAEEALDLTDPNDPASRPTPPTLTLLSDPPVQNPCASWAGRVARFGGADAESALTLLAQTRLPGGDWGVLTRGVTPPRIAPLGPQTEYRVGVADALGVAFLDGQPGGRADHLVWSDVFTLECVDPRPRLAATLAEDGTLTLRNLGTNPLEAEVIPARFRAEAEQRWAIDPPQTVTDGAPFTWPLPWMHGLTKGTKVTFTYDYTGDDGFFTPGVLLMNGTLLSVAADVVVRSEAGSVKTADFTLSMDYPYATDLCFQPTMNAFDEIEPYAVLSVTLSGRNVWTPATADEVSPIGLATVPGGGAWAGRLTFDPALPLAERAVFIRSNDPVEPRCFLPWPRHGYRLRLR